MTERTYIKDLKEKVGTEVTLKGWIDVRRDQGKLIFLDFRDKTGYVQGVVLPNATEAQEGAAINQELQSGAKNAPILRMRILNSWESFSWIAWPEKVTTS